MNSADPKVQQRQPISALINGGALYIGDGYRAKLEELSSVGLPFARAGNIDGGFQFEDADCFPEENLKRVGNKISIPGDVVFTSKGTVGRFAFVRESTPRFVYSPQLCFWRVLNRNKINSRFLYYWMSSHEFHSQFRGVAGQTDMAEYVSLGDQRRMYITLPAIDHQKEIADLLGTLDDKIELNRRMNETLEAIARAIFKSWFIDFDPATTDAPSKHHFPSQLASSELGLIPKGWQIGAVADLTSLIIGGDWGEEQKDAAATEAVLCIRGADIADLQVGGLGKLPVRYLKESSLATRNLHRHDIVVEISGGSPTQSTGRPVLITSGLLKRFALPITCSNFCRLVRVKDPNYSYFLYLFLRHLYVSDEFLQYENGTTGIKNFAFTDFSQTYRFAIPDTRLAAAFSTTVGPLFDLMQANGSQIDTLAECRDLLLPKLISGEIRLTQAQKIVEAHA